MKKLTTIILFLSAINCYSQITTVTTKEKPTESIEVQKYDSLESLDIENARFHTGQTLFLKGDKYSKENGFYFIFFTSIVPDGWVSDSYIYKPTPRKGKGEIVTSYSELAGKYYNILSIKTEHSIMHDSVYWLELINNNEASFYYKLTSNSYDFVTLGYYEKMKQTFVDKEFYFKGRYKINKVDTAETIIPPFKTKFKCIDIAVNVGEDGPIFAVLENEKFGRVKGEIIKGRKLDNFITISYYNECVKKYGAKFGSYVAEGKIEMGMNKKMVKDAWGSPDHVNVTQGSYGIHEQWVYDDRYLYFKNGILTSKQY